MDSKENGRLTHGQHGLEIDLRLPEDLTGSDLDGLFQSVFDDITLVDGRPFLEIRTKWERKRIPLDEHGGVHLGREELEQLADTIKYFQQTVANLSRSHS